METTIKKLTKKSWKFGTYAYSTYFCNGVELKTLSDHQNQCGVGYFIDLPEDEVNAIEEEIGINDLPHEIYDLIYNT